MTINQDDLDYDSIREQSTSVIGYVEISSVFDKAASTRVVVRVVYEDDEEGVWMVLERKLGEPKAKFLSYYW